SASEADNTNASLIFLASERLQAHAHAFLESAVLLFRLLQRELVGGLRFGGLVFRQQNVAAHGGVLRFVGRRVLGIEKLERLVVRLFAEQHRGEAQPREVAQIVRRRIHQDLKSSTCSCSSRSGAIASFGRWKESNLLFTTSTIRSIGTTDRSFLPRSLICTTLSRNSFSPAITATRKAFLSAYVICFDSF